jgi:tungstate transport system permease protein
VETFTDILLRAFALIAQGDPVLRGVVGLSLYVTLSATAIACTIGLPLGAVVGGTQFAGRGSVIVFLNALMGLPPVVVGLVVYLILSASGPLGVLSLLYTPAAMIIAQTILIMPIVAALTVQVTSDMHYEYREQFCSMGVGRLARIGALMWDARLALMPVVLAGFGRAVAEVGAVMIVGGNINHVTRVMTTSIALETSKGNLELALALGIVLLLIALLVNAAVMALRSASVRAAYA